VGSFGEDTATINHARNAWASTNIVAGVALNPMHDVHSLDTLAENDIASVAPCTRVGGDEELGRVCIRTPVGHGKQSTTVM